MAVKRHSSDIPDIFQKRARPDRAVMGRVEHYMTLHFNAAFLRQHPTIITSPQHQHYYQQRLSHSPPLSPNSTTPPPPLSMGSSPSPPPSEVSSSASTSPTLEPTQYHYHPQFSPPMFQLPKPVSTNAAAGATGRKPPSRSPSSPLSAIPEDTPMPDVVDADDDGRLYDINLEVKSTLTDLLNCESIKHDEKMRMWVQGRLMEAEMELKRQRRRRSSTTSASVGKAV